MNKRNCKKKIKEPTEYTKCIPKDEPQPPKYTWEVDSIMHIDGSTSYNYYWRKIK